MKNRKLVYGAALLLTGVTCLVSCNKTFDETKNITVVTREDGSGTKSAFMEIIGLKGKSDVSNAVIATGTAAVLEEVKSNSYAIAFDSLGYITSDVKKLTVDGVEATVANIQSGDYTISRPLNVIYKESTITSNKLYSTYLSYLTSSQAATIISDNGYVSLVSDAKEYTIDSTLSGKIEISGSTSLQPLMIKLADKFEELQANVTIEVSGGGSGTGYTNGENGISVFGMISENFNSTKAPSCTYYTVAKDGIGIIVNNGNPHTNISKTNLKNIYNVEAGDDAITTWEKVS